MSELPRVIARFVALYRTTELPRSVLSVWLERLSDFPVEEVKASFRRLETSSMLPPLIDVLTDLRGATKPQERRPFQHNDRCGRPCREGIVVLLCRGDEFVARCDCPAGDQHRVGPLGKLPGVRALLADGLLLKDTPPEGRPQNVRSITSRLAAAKAIGEGR